MSCKLWARQLYWVRAICFFGHPKLFLTQARFVFPSESWRSTSFDLYLNACMVAVKETRTFIVLPTICTVSSLYVYLEVTRVPSPVPSSTSIPTVYCRVPLKEEFGQELSRTLLGLWKMYRSKSISRVSFVAAVLRYSTGGSKWWESRIRWCAWIWQ